MDEKSLDLIVGRLDRMEDKIDSLVEHKWMWIGRMSAFTFCASIVVSYFINELWSKK
jgi:hypothetical protein